MSRMTVSIIAAAVASSVALSAAEASTEAVLYSFNDNGTDGYNPASALINFKDSLYGVTVLGGAYSDGTVFSVRRKTGAEKVVYSFGASSGDGIKPVGALLNIGGTFYGTTTEGGGADGGTIFALDPGTGAETILYEFLGDTDGYGPFGDLINVDGTLYGTTLSGGTYNDGTVFAFDPTTKKKTTLYSFCKELYCTDGETPNAGLVDVKGTIYGTTSAGGTLNGGTAFSIGISSRAESVIYSFCRAKDCRPGVFPFDGPIDLNGNLYGTANGGGPYNQGTVFKINPVTDKETVLHSFKGGQDGAQPNSGLIDVGNMMYGTTPDGGGFGCGYGCGTVFSFDLKAGTEKIVYSFQDNGTDAVGPVFSLLAGGRALYGVTPAGGSYGYGAVFKVRP